MVFIIIFDDFIIFYAVNPLNWFDYSPVVGSQVHLNPSTVIGHTAINHFMPHFELLSYINS